MTGPPVLYTTIALFQFLSYVFLGGEGGLGGFRISGHSYKSTNLYVRPSRSVAVPNKIVRQEEASNMQIGTGTQFPHVPLVH
jgi:hypothetical protein